MLVASIRAITQPPSLMRVNVYFEQYHERKKTTVERREKRDAEVQISVDNKCARILIKVITVTTRDTYSFRDISDIKLNEKIESLTIISTDKHCALTISSNECTGGTLSVLNHLRTLYDSMREACDNLPSLLKEKVENERIVNENINSINTFSKASNSEHISKDRVDSYYSEERFKSGLTPSKKKPRDTLTPRRDKRKESKEIGDEYGLKLTRDQTEVISSALSGENIFVTGGAGTGKSLLLEKLVLELRSRTPDGVFVTATSGMSACAISGTTIHQFAGISSPIDESNCPQETLVQIAKDIKKKRNAVDRWKSCAVLIIDEVSMLGRKVFEALDIVAREVRECDEVFGGVQVILVGDFYQLPPVVRYNNQLGSTTSAIRGHFCFDSPVWRKLITRCHLLKTVFRQKQTLFVEVLEDIRQGNLSKQGKELLQRCVGRHVGDAVHLFTHRNEANMMNEAEIEKLPGSKYTYMAVDKSKDTNKGYLKMLQNSTIVPQKLVLKKETPIILLKTLDVSKGLVNGARGEVCGFSTQGYPIVAFPSGEKRVLTPMKFKIFMSNSEVASRTQVPCCLGWALSVHKSQGMSIDVASLHLRNVFEYGQVYVALSRARDVDKLSIDCPIDKNHVCAHPRVKEFYKSCDFRCEYSLNTE